MIPAPAKPDTKTIEEQLDRILRSRAFSASKRSQRFLRYVVDKSLSDSASPPKEFAIAMDVFDRDSSYDPAIDATVRVQAGRLRGRLREYYDSEGKDDPIWIDIPIGGYVPVFSVRETATVEPGSRLAPNQEPPPDRTALKRIGAPSGFRRILSARVLLPLTALCLILVATVVARRQARPDSPIHSLAVLPLENLSNDPEQEYFADGMTEELITDLSYAKSLRVVSRSSTIGFKKSHLSVPQIAEQLHVDALIEGTVLRVNDKVRITIRLTAAKPERQLWAASYERNLSDAISLQNQIAAEAVAQIRTQLMPEARTRLSMESQINPEAYDEYLRARFLLRQEKGEAVQKAIPHLERAIQLDPNFAAAYAALGEAWCLPWVNMKNPRETYAKGLEYSQKAVSLDPNSSETFASLGHSLMQNHRWNEGEVALRRAIDLDANNPYPVQYLAVLLMHKGRVDESLQISRQLAVANPVAPDFQSQYATMLYRARKYDDAIAQSQRTIDLDPNHGNYESLANALAQTGRYPEAEIAFKKDNKESLLRPGVQAWLYALEGNREGARRILNDNPGFVDPHTAVVRYLLGDREAGLAELGKLTDQWNTKTYNLRNDALFDPMRNDPRFTAIVKRSGLLDN